MPAFAGMTSIGGGRLTLLGLFGGLLFGGLGLLRLGLRRCGVLGRSPLILELVLAGGHLVGGCLGHQRHGLRYPVLVLDHAVKRERLIDIGDLVVGEIGDLFELDHAELVQLLLELGRDAGDQLQIVGLALGLGEALEGLLLLAPDVLAFGNAGGLAAPSSQIIELGATHAAPAYHLDRVDQRRMDGEDALDALAIGNLAHGEILVHPAAGAPDAYALIGLHAAALALDHLDVDANRVSGAELRHLALLGEGGNLLFLELLDNIHGHTFRWAPALAKGLPANAI